MFCKTCGYQLDDNATVCPNCEQAKAEQANAEVFQQEYPAAQQNFNPYQQVDPAYMINPVAQRYNGIFSDSLFLVSCICISISTVLGFISGSIDVLNILFTIFMWLTYSSAKSGRITAMQLRRTSGAVYALRIVNWVLVGAYGLVAILSIAIPSVVISVLSKYNLGVDIDDIAYLLGGGSVLAVVFLIVFLIAAAITTLVNIFFYGNLHKLAKAFYISVETGNEQLPNIGVIKTLLLVFGILSGIGALGQLKFIPAFIVSAASAANYIILSVWLKKNFVKIGYSN